MKKRGAVLGVILLVLLLGLGLYNFKITKFYGKWYILKIARSRQAKVKGLSYTSSLPSYRGLIMLWDKPQTVGIWGYEMSYSIDVYYLNDDGVVKGAVCSLDPCINLDSCPVYKVSDVSTVIEVPPREDCTKIKNGF